MSTLAVPFNPLDRQAIAENIQLKIVSRPYQPLDSEFSFKGAGIYVLYYMGDLRIYKNISLSNTFEMERPIYVGQAIPKGSRIGGFKDLSAGSSAIASRLKAHARKIKKVQNLKIGHFYFRYLVIDDAFISLAESVMIEKFQPFWNVYLFGFGNNKLGYGRLGQKASRWDVFHPGQGAGELVRKSVVATDELFSKSADMLKVDVYISNLDEILPEV